ncbi:hypothetical protein WG66_003805 [Moniliophthora roreri]|nr:hypothetical protein WG66_003805 [Moniliophthora roreri]
MTLLPGQTLQRRTFSLGTIPGLGIVPADVNCCPTSPFKLYDTLKVWFPEALEDTALRNIFLQRWQGGCRRLELAGVAVDNFSDSSLPHLGSSQEAVLDSNELSPRKLHAILSNIHIHLTDSYLI